MTAFFHSIRFRLLLWFTAILVLVMLVFSMFIYLNQVRDLEDDALGRLSRRLAVVQEGLRISLRQQGGQLVLPENLFQDTDIFVLVNSSGQIVASRGTTSAEEVVQHANNYLKNRAHPQEPFEANISWVDGNDGFVAAPIFGESGQPSPEVS